MVARDDQRGVGRGAQQKVAHGAGDGALVKVVAGEEAARADLGPPRRQVLAHAVVVVARVDVGEIADRERYERSREVRRSPTGGKLTKSVQARQRLPALGGPDHIQLKSHTPS